MLIFLSTENLWTKVICDKMKTCFLRLTLDPLYLFSCQNLSSFFKEVKDPGSFWLVKAEGHALKSYDFYCKGLFLYLKGIDQNLTVLKYSLYKDCEVNLCSELCQCKSGIISLQLVESIQEHNYPDVLGHVMPMENNGNYVHKQHDDWVLNR